MPKTKCVGCGRICWTCRKCRNRTWSDTLDVRVRAKGMAGAIWQGVREARRDHLEARTHVRQVRVTAVGA